MGIVIVAALTFIAEAIALGIQSQHFAALKSRRVSRTLKLEFYLVHAARNISGQHEKEIDALGSAGESPTCRCGTIVLLVENASNPSGDLIAVLGSLPSSQMSKTI